MHILACLELFFLNSMLNLADLDCPNSDDFGRLRIGSGLVGGFTQDFGPRAQMDFLGHNTFFDYSDLYLRSLMNVGLCYVCPKSPFSKSLLGSFSKRGFRF